VAIEAADGCVVCAAGGSVVGGASWACGGEEDAELKIAEAASHVMIGSAGLAGDARRGVAAARHYAAGHRLEYGDRAPVGGVGDALADFAAASSGIDKLLGARDPDAAVPARPIGAAFLAAGCASAREGPAVFAVDAGGAPRRWRAAACGAGADAAHARLEAELRALCARRGHAWPRHDDRPPWGLDDAVAVACGVLRDVRSASGPLRPELAVVRAAAGDGGDPAFARLDADAFAAAVADLDGQRRDAPPAAAADAAAAFAGGVFAADRAERPIYLALGGGD